MTDYQTVHDFICGQVPTMLKEPRAFIRYPFVDPGSVYDGNVWDWDTYWSVYGLLSIAGDLPPALCEQVITHAKGNIANFMDHQLPDGYIPMMIEVANWPEPYLNMRRKEGVKLNMMKPFLCGQIRMIAAHLNDWAWASGYLPGMEAYVACYEREYFHADCGLYGWHDDIMIGMDNDPASFGRPNDSTANIFLNAFMAAELACMAEALEAFGNPARAAVYRQKREDLIAAVQRECWDARDGFFYSVDVDIHTRPYDWFHQGLGVFWKSLPIKIRVWSGFIPLWAGFATPAQAARMAAHSLDESTFASPYGVTTLAKDEKMFDLSVTNNPSNWLGPVWIVANYVVFKGLLDYGHRAEAKRILDGTLRLLAEDVKRSGQLHEYYDPFTGQPIMNGGFINWNILALTMQKEWEAVGC